jgi:hypothetical protein
MEIHLRQFGTKQLNKNKRSRLSFSVGLVVIDNKSNVYLLERRLPYQLEKILYKRKLLACESICNAELILDMCENLQKESYSRDIARFISSQKYPQACYFEDQYDIPHGQSHALRKLLNYRGEESHVLRTISSNLKPLLIDAYREWTEETGLSITNFSIQQHVKDKMHIKAFILTFLGGDKILYTQLFFIVCLEYNQLVVSGTTRKEYAYKTRVVKINEAINILRKQDYFVDKYSFKSLMLKCIRSQYEGTQYRTLVIKNF